MKNKYFHAIRMCAAVGASILLSMACFRFGLKIASFALGILGAILLVALAVMLLVIWKNEKQQKNE